MKMLATFHFRLLCGFSLFLLSFAQEKIVIQGESFNMYCYNVPVIPVGGDPTYYIELEYSTSPDDKTVIAKYQPSSNSLTGSVTISSSPFYNRVSFNANRQMILSNVRVHDEGTYQCSVKGFSITDEDPQTSGLVVHVRPQIEITKMTDPLTAGTSLVNAASCSAKNGKPAAEISWSTSRNLALNYTDSSSAGSELGTTSTVSTLYVAPTKFYNGETFMCNVQHPAFSGGLNVSIISLKVEYPPSIPTIIVKKDGTELVCSSDANPPATIVWTMPDVAPTPTVVSDRVMIISPQDPARQNDTYVCTASNKIEPSQFTSITTAEASVRLEMVNQSNTGVIVGAVIGAILIIVIILALVYWFLIRKHREKDEGPYNPKRNSQRSDGGGHWGRPAGRPTIEHANESLNKNRPPSPSQPPPHDDEEHRASVSSHSDMEEDMEGHDVDINSPLTGVDDDDMPTAGIVSKNSVNFQHRRQRPSTSPHRRSQKGPHPEPSPRMITQSDPHYEVPPQEYYDDEYGDEDAPLADHRGNEEPMDDRFYDLPENRYPDYQRYQQPPQRVESLPPYTQDAIQYASIDHSYKDPTQPRTRPPYLEPVEYAEIRSHGQIV